MLLNETLFALCFELQVPEDWIPLAIKYSYSVSLISLESEIGKGEEGNIFWIISYSTFAMLSFLFFCSYFMGISVVSIVKKFTRNNQNLVMRSRELLVHFLVIDDVISSHT